MKRIHNGGGGRGKGEGGAVVFLALLVVVMLAALGTIGVRSVQFELATSGSIRQATQTRYIADAGVMVSVWEFGSSGKLSAFLREMRQCAVSTTPGIQQFCGSNYWIFDYDRHFHDLTPGIFVLPASAGDYHALGYSPMRPAFTARVDNKVPIIAVPGYSVAKSNVSGDEYEFQRWTFTSQGSEKYFTNPALFSRSDSSDTLRVVSVVGPVRREK